MYILLKNIAQRSFFAKKVKFRLIWPHWPQDPPRVNVDVDGEEEEDALEVVLEDGRVQEVAASSVVLFSRQRLDLEKTEEPV